VVFGVFYALYLERSLSHSIHVVKGIFFDWVVLIIFFPVTALSDLFLQTNLFLSVVSYFCGANFFAVTTVKLAEWMWKLDYANQLKRGATTTITSTPKAKPVPISHEAPTSRTISGAAISEPTKDSVLFFESKFSMPASLWERLHLEQLVMCFAVMCYLMSLRMVRHPELVDRWQISFFIASASTIMMYLGPIAARSTITQQQRDQMEDAVN